MRKQLVMIGMGTVSAFALNAIAGTVAYWPLAYENGSRMIVSSRLESIGTVAGLEVKPICLDGDVANEAGDGSDCFPVGTNAFPSSYGVYDPIAGTNLSAITCLYFKTAGAAASGYTAGALKVDDSGGALHLATFTVECFIRRQGEIPRNGAWNAVAVIPRVLDNNGTKVVNCDSWGLRVVNFATGQVRIRFYTEPDVTYDSTGHEVSGGSSLSVVCNDIGDGNWHHLAFSVDDSTHKARIYYDYEFVDEMALPYSVKYGKENLYIGASPETPNPFGGSIAHFRISDEALAPEQFLKFTRTAASPNEPEDVVLHVNFDKVDGISRNVVFNEAAKGSPVWRVVDNGFPKMADATLPTSETRASLTSSASVTNTGCMTNVYKKLATSYYTWLPPDDSFTNKSFTVECFYKTTEAHNYHYLVRRRVANATQFSLNLHGESEGAGKLTMIGKWANKTSSITSESDASNDGEWHHGALVIDTCRNIAWLYRDYRLVASLANVGAISGSLPDLPVCIGGNDSPTSSNKPSFGGCIDEVRITMRALTPGEFLTSEYFDLSSKTLAWASYDNILDSAVSQYALCNGVAESGTDGSPPSFAPMRDGQNIFVEDGGGNLLRKGDFCELSCCTGIVKYAFNPLLPLFPTQTIEFFVKANAGQKGDACIIRYNPSATASNPTLILVFTGGDKLKLRCGAQKNDGTFASTAINENTGVVIADGKSHHIALTISQTYADGDYSTTLNIYKDYVAEPAWTKVIPGRLHYAGDCCVWVGGGNTACMNGSLDELRISNGVLGVSEFLRRVRRCGFVVCIK